MKRISKEIKISVAFLVSIVLLYVGVNFLKGSNVFSHDNTYYTVVGNAGGVASGGQVMANGFQVGTVNRVVYDYACPDRIVLALRVNESLRIPKGSRALLVNSLLGGVSIELKLAQAVECYADGDTIPSGVANGLTGQIEHVMLPQINALVPKVDSLIVALTVLVTNPAVDSSLSNVESISSKLDRTADELNRLFHNDNAVLRLFQELMQTLCPRISEREAAVVCTNRYQSLLSEVDIADTLRIRVREGHLVRE